MKKIKLISLMLVLLSISISSCKVYVKNKGAEHSIPTVVNNDDKHPVPVQSDGIIKNDDKHPVPVQSDGIIKNEDKHPVPVKITEINNLVNNTVPPELKGIIYNYIILTPQNNVSGRPENPLGGVIEGTKFFIENITETYGSSWIKVSSNTYGPDKRLIGWINTNAPSFLYVIIPKINK